MTVYQIRRGDKVYPIHANSPEEAWTLSEQIPGAAEAQATTAPEEPSILGRFASRTGFAGLSQVPGAIADIAGQGVVGGAKALAGGLAGTAGAVAGEFAPSAIASQYQHLRGQGMTPVGSALGSIPLLGKTAETISSDIVGGKIPEIAGDIFSAAPMLLGVKSFRESPVANAPIRPPAIPNELGPALKSVAKDTIAGPAAAGAVGGLIAGPVGAGVAASTVRLAQAIAEKVSEARQAEIAARQAVAAHVETAATGAQASAFESMMNAWKAAAERVKAEENAAARLEATREKYRGLSSPQELKMAKDQIAAQEIDAKARGLSPDEFKIQRDYLDALDMDMRRAAADTKAQEAASIAGAKAELRPLEAADAVAGKQIAAAERTAVKGEAQGQKIDLKQISDTAKRDANVAAQLLKDTKTRETASFQAAGVEAKILEASQKAQALAEAELAAAVKAMENAGTKEAAAAERAVKVATEKAAKAAERTKAAEGRAEAAQIRREYRQRTQMDKAAAKEAAKAKPAEVPAAAPENPILTQIEGPQVVKGVEAPKAPAAPPAEIIKGVEMAPAAKSTLEKATSLSNTLGKKGYDAATIEAQLMKSHPTLDAAMAKKLASSAPKPEALGYQDAALAQADKGWTITEIAAKLINQEGLTQNQALKAAYDSVVSRVKMTAEQAAEVAQIKGKNLKKVRLEDIKPSRKPLVEPLATSPKPKP